jgi:hypothetical protein
MAIYVHAIYVHYERVTIGDQKLIKLAFSSSATRVHLHFTKDPEFTTVITLLKQIPAGKRDYNPATRIWTVPESALEIFETLNIDVFEHPNLDAFINPPSQSEAKAKHWADSLRDQVKVEAAEDFFKGSPVISGVSNPEALQQRLTAIISRYVSFELKDRESFLRGYKLTARKLHPDFGGDAQKMSELNELWAQYKEVSL